MSQTDRPTKWLIWLLPAVWLAGLVGSVSLYLAGCGRIYADLAFIVVVSAAFTALGLLIVVYRPANRIGWLCSVIGVSMVVVFEFAWTYSTCALQGSVTLPGAAYVAWLNYVGQPLWLVLTFALLPLWFPDGQFLTPRWRRLTFVFLTATGGSVALAGLLPGPLAHNGIGLVLPTDNPFGLALLPASLSDVIDEAIVFPIVGSAFVGIASLIVRWRRSRGDTRQQLKWFACFLGTAVTFELLLEGYGAAFQPDITGTRFETFYMLVVWVASSDFRR